MITLATLPNATKQEIFDQVAEHLLRQNKTSAEGANCKYRFGNLKCAAGCLIADDEYHRSMEGLSWLNLADQGTVPQEHKGFISQLQSVHDGGGIGAWANDLKDLAEVYELEYKF